MQPIHSRRKFLRNVGMAAGASVAGTGWGIAKPRSARRSGLAQRSLSKVISFANTYGEDVCLCGASGAIQVTGAGIKSPVNMLVSVSDHGQLVSALQQDSGLPFSKVHSHGNTLSFSYSGRDYLVENIDPATYANRIAHINSQGVGAEGRNAAYAHDYVTYETKTRKLTDPHNAIRGSKVTLKKVIGNSTPLDFEDVIIGMIECATLEILPSATLATEWASTLANSAPNDPQSVINILLARLHDITTSMKQAEVTELLGSPLISTSLNSILGMKGKTLTSNFNRIKANAPRSCDASLIWQAAFLKSCPEGITNRQLQDGFLNNIPPANRHTAGTRWKKACSLAY